jgi:phosphoglycolate phosphatase
MTETPSRSAPPKFTSVIFDLDGTLVDSTEDIAGALNKALAAHTTAVVTPAQVAHALGGGPRVLVEKCLAAAGVDVSGEVLDDILRDYSANYIAEPVVKTRLLDSAGEIIRTLDARGVTMGVCTNKRTAIARQVLQALGLADFIGAVVGSDATASPKPHPQHLIDTAQALAVPTGSVLYVGDTAIDARTSAAAGIAYGHVAWGQPDVGADFALGSFADLLHIT